MTQENLEPTFLLLQLPQPTLERASRMAQDAGIALEKFILLALEEKMDLDKISPG